MEGHFVSFTFIYKRKYIMFTQESLNLYLSEANIMRSELFGDLPYEEGEELVLMKIESLFNCSLLEWCID